MEPKYVEAIKAGIIGGVIVSVIELFVQLTTLVGIIRNSDYSTDASGGLAVAAFSIICCLFILYLLVMLGTGMLAVRMARPWLRDIGEAMAASAVAGVVAGLIWGIVSDVLRMVVSLAGYDYTDTTSRIGGSIFFGVCGLICCLPIGVIVAVILTIIGGAAYYALVLDKGGPLAT